MNRVLKKIIRPVAFCVPFAVCLLSATPVFAGVVITEIQYDPPGTDTGFEWVEIVNDGNTAADITKYRFYEAKVKHRIKDTGKQTLEPSESAVIVQDSAKFSSVYPDYTDTMFLSSFSLRQSGGIGETLGIVNPSGEFDFKYAYTPDDRANGTGASLHITMSGTQIAAPATPGSVATNPITVHHKKPEHIQEEETPEEEEVLLEDLVEEALVEKTENTATDMEGLMSAAVVSDGKWNPTVGATAMPTGSGFAYPHYYDNGRLIVPPFHYRYPIPFPYYQTSASQLDNTVPQREIAVISTSLSPLVWIAIILSILVVELFALLVILYRALLPITKRKKRRRLESCVSTAKISGRSIADIQKNRAGK